MNEDLLRPFRRVAFEQDAFWLLAGVTERSYEEPCRGRTRNRFAEAVAWYEELGVSPEVTRLLRGGINGSVQTYLEEDGWRITHRSQAFGPGGMRPDFVFEREPGGERTVAEVKLLFDCTLPKYLTAIAEDRRKLERICGEDRVGSRVQIVYFLQLPHYDYPAGRWYGNKDCESRSRWTRYVGLDRQYTELRKHITEEPSWPVDGPCVQSLVPPLDSPVVADLGRWFEAVFEPVAPWTFDPELHLRDAAIGVAAWSV